jgi:hypothetical protein
MAQKQKKSPGIAEDAAMLMDDGEAGLLLLLLERRKWGGIGEE